MMDWLSRDGKLLLAVRPLQSFASSFVSVFFAVFLSVIGLPLWQIGLVLTGGLLFSTFLNLVAGFLADQVGRRKMLVLFGLIAARIAKRIGLINTMVFSHLPANMMTMMIPFMPNLASSILLYLSRALLSQMDVPTRQSYVMAIVKPEERSRVAGIINLPRSLTLAVSPSLAGFIMEFLGLSLPFPLPPLPHSRGPEGGLRPHALLYLQGRETPRGKKITI